ncbi:hypothetical protein [Streptomyces netropsis]|uniref:Uncharacterized protein n=1 Tax=Streptomyces netropsis TaxID=55404 RepID=A0A7W7LC63_STRNE|nr:hypothetical protein [Streptomyces netropsis]MBB4887513.1 hypothetical protein [Streptomyces netropsis]GGR35252.1 hypothetical protein GCM10010219_45410 [Streptomyces netropsis]
MRSTVSYRTLAGDVRLEVASAKIDSHDLPYSRISREQQTVALHEVERARWDEARFEVRVTLPEREIAEGPWEDVVCVAVLAEGATNARSVTRLAPTQQGAWTGRVHMARAMHRNRAVLTASVVATVGGVPGRVIGGTERPWYLDLAARDPRRERELNIIEVDFRDGPEQWLRPFKEAPWLVDATGDMPTVRLNTAFEGVIDLLNGSGSPVEKAMRDVVAAQIAEEAWTAMFHSAVTDLDFDEDGTPRLPSGWRGAVLRSMLPEVVPAASLESALHEVHKRRNDGQSWSEMQASIQYAAARRSKVAKGLRDAVRVLDRVDEGARR